MSNHLINLLPHPSSQQVKKDQCLSTFSIVRKKNLIINEEIQFLDLFQKKINENRSGTGNRDQRKPGSYAAELFFRIFLHNFYINPQKIYKTGRHKVTRLTILMQDYEKSFVSPIPSPKIKTGCKNRPVKLG